MRTKFLYLLHSYLMKPLKILISNDDGVFAEGIRTLANFAFERGHEVTVVCPDQERSATGHGLTLQSPIRVEKADELFAKGVKAWGCTGTPADCVKLALHEILETKPDLVLSGVNHGPNLGTDIFCSGTVAAALEGTLEGIPSLAVSITSFQWKKFNFAAKIAMDIVEKAITSKWPPRLLLNLNIPPCDEENMGSLHWTRLSIRHYKEQFSKRIDPRGNTYFWLAGEAVDDFKSVGDGPTQWLSDVEQVGKNAPSITPIEPDLIWRRSISELPDILNNQLAL